MLGNKQFERVTFYQCGDIVRRSEEWIGPGHDAQQDHAGSPHVHGGRLKTI